MLYQKYSAFCACLMLLAGGPAHARLVAIVDSGITPVPDVAPFLVPGGFDFANNDPNPIDDNGHGTVVGFITVVASNERARLLPIKSFNAQAVGLNSWVTQGIAFAARHPNVRVINLSLKSGVFDVPQLETIKDATKRGKMIVMAAGNTGLPNPDFPAGTVNQLKGHGLAVGAVGPSRNIRPYSARAGTSKEFYVVARDFLEEGLGGTSFAAPQVSGVAAAIFDQSPFLSAKEVVDIIRRTAVDLGAPGVDTVYGHGLLNRAAALGPVGAARIPTGNDTSGPSGEFTGAALTLGAPFAYAILENNPRLSRTLILDEYQRPFSADLTAAISVPSRITELASLMRTFRQETGSVYTDVGSVALRAWVSDDPALRATYALDPFGQRDYEERVPFASFMLEGGAPAGLYYGFGYNVDPRTVFGMFEGDRAAPVRFLSSETFDAPYLSFGAVSDTLHFGYRLNERTDVLLGWTNTDDRERYGHQSQTATVRARYQATDALSLSARLTNTEEQGGLFGGASDGAFAIDDARTVAVGAGAEYRFGSKLALVGQYTYGYTRVANIAGSLLGDFSTLRGEAYGLGLVAGGVFRRDDRFGIMVSRPLRVIGGEAEIRIPNARDFDGRVFAETESVNLVPNGRETDLEVAYALPVTPTVDVEAHVLWQHEPFHSARLDDRMTVAAAIRKRF